MYMYVYMYTAVLVRIRVRRGPLRQGIILLEHVRLEVDHAVEGIVGWTEHAVFLGRRTRGLIHYGTPGPGNDRQIPGGAM